jgi:hypothetical protein
LQNSEVFDVIHIGEGVVMRVMEVANIVSHFKVATEGLVESWAGTENSNDSAIGDRQAFNSLGKALRLLRQNVWPSSTEIELVVWPELGDGDDRDERKTKAKKPYHVLRYKVIGKCSKFIFEIFL